MLIIAIILLGMLAGAAGRWIVGQFSSATFSVTEAFVAGLAGSFVGGLVLSLLTGNGLDLHPTGIIGSIVGAVVILAVWAVVRTRSAASR